jgi:hypothetical protein
MLHCYGAGEHYRLLDEESTEFLNNVSFEESLNASNKVLQIDPGNESA